MGSCCIREKFQSTSSEIHPEFYKNWKSNLEKQSQKRSETLSLKRIPLVEIVSNDLNSNILNDHNQCVSPHILIGDPSSLQNSNSKVLLKEQPIITSIEIYNLRQFEGYVFLSHSCYYNYQISDEIHFDLSDHVPIQRKEKEINTYNEEDNRNQILDLCENIERNDEIIEKDEEKEDEKVEEQDEKIKVEDEKIKVDDEKEDFSKILSEKLRESLMHNEQFRLSQGEIQSDVNCECYDKTKDRSQTSIYSEREIKQISPNQQNIMESSFDWTNQGENNSSTPSGKLDYDSKDLAQNEDTRLKLHETFLIKQEVNQIERKKRLKQFNQGMIGGNIYLRQGSYTPMSSKSFAHETSGIGQSSSLHKSSSDYNGLSFSNKSPSNSSTRHTHTGISSNIISVPNSIFIPSNVFDHVKHSDQAQ